MSNAQWAGPLLDRLIAPEFSTLTSFLLSDVPELPNYYGSFFINNAFRSEFEDKARPLVFAMLRYLTQATREYRAGSLAEFGNAKPQSNDAVTLYLRALTRFEQAVIHCDLTVGLSHAVARCIDAGTPEKHFKSGENSPEERLRFLYNALKHFDRTIAAGSLPDRAAPIWIVTEGLKGVLESKKGGAPDVKILQFGEMADILKELAGNAQFLAEEVYRLAHERHAAKTIGAEKQAD